jgi:ferredoxin
MTAVSAAFSDGVARLADDCRQCYQCGQCTAACPQGWDLDRGPRRVIRFVLAESNETLLEADDFWRCNECGTCTRNCPMEVPVMETMAALRDLERAEGSLRCPERTSTQIATFWLGKRRRIDNLSFGAAMVARGHLPRDPIGSAGQGTAAARSLLARAGRRAGKSAGQPSEPTPGATRVPFFTGCALPQDPDTAAATRSVAAQLGVALEELESAGCCGHPARGAHPTTLRADGPVYTVCPACDHGLRDGGVEAVPVWEALVDHARTAGIGLRAAAPAFVPYIGCLVDRERGLDTFARSAGLSGAEMLLSYPSLHSACCGAVGSMFRGETEGARRLLGFASERRAPIVTTCLLCRDNMRSAARRNRLSVDVHLWPEFFTGDAHDWRDHRRGPGRRQPT